MNAVFSDQPLAVKHPSLFLAGPTPRSPKVPSWRPAALDILRQMRFEGTVLVPERRDWSVKFDYYDQVEWEFEGLEAATVLAFWVPRDPPSLSGFTTNVEFGRYVGTGRVVYGRPEGAPHTRYLDWLYAKLTGRLPETTLEGTLRATVDRSAS
jgi:Nucleoside 2-deoxyribosyltransferase like